ncbi:hypothetical protein N9A60_01435 [Akkermansiaceae bacterium]|nr:hypothetical protein [Akkermansiaceae bacterium]
MKTLISTNLRTRALAFASLFCAGSASVQAQFINLSGNDVKVVFEQVDYNGQLVTEATASKRTGTLANGNVEAKEMTFKTVADGAGGFTRIIVQKTVTATLDLFNNKWSVTTTSSTASTPVDSQGTVIGGTTNTPATPTVISGLLENELDLPPTTSFTAIDPNLDTPVVISLP